MEKQALSSLETILIENRFITAAQSAQAQSGNPPDKVPLFEMLASVPGTDEARLGQVLADYYHVRYLAPDAISSENNAKGVLSEEVMVTHQVYPIAYDKGSHRLEVLMLEPDRTLALDEIARLTDCRIIPRVTTPKKMFSLLRGFSKYHLSTDLALARAEGEKKTDFEGINDAGNSALEQEMLADDAPVVQLVNAIISEAVSKGASDIHLESHKEMMIVRFRIDGILRDFRTIPRTLASALISRIKVTGGMDISERRRPQDGRINQRIANIDVDMRVNSLPSQYGESVVMRLLRSGATSVGLEKLGLDHESEQSLMRMIKNPHGIILVTGPTGSGKTTTLYSCLREVNTRERKIITIEDPIEYPLPGVNQTQVSPKAGLDFSISLRAIMRQDPDIILLGEIRDHETLEAAMHAALTGHLVFSSIHTNSTAKTITRLKELGSPSYLISTTVIGIVAQRLVRKICTHCKHGYQASMEELKMLGFQNTTHPITLYRGEGCDLCEHTGYQGRVGLYEVMSVNRTIQDLIDADTSSGSLQDSAVSNGMVTLGMDGERKIAMGLTTVDEVTRVLGLDW